MQGAMVMSQLKRAEFFGQVCVRGEGEGMGEKWGGRRGEERWIGMESEGE